MRNGNERKSSPLHCDIGLGLKMQLQPTQSYTSGGPLFSYTSNRVADCVGDIHQSSFQNTPFRPPGLMMSGKALFTESQWQEFEKQNMIHKYLSASAPVPHQLLLSSSSSLPQSNMASGFELRFGKSGCSDPEPWRCKRTDGKKWRCSRDVAPHHKYCERHAQKTRSRSRKHVEITSQPQTITNRSTSQSSPSYEQTRSIEWFMRGGGSSSTSTTITPVPASKHLQKWQQQITQMPPDYKEKAPSRNKNVSSLYQPQQDYEENQGFYAPDTSNINKHHKMDLSHTTQTTRHFNFIDSWEKDIGIDIGLSTKDKSFLHSSLSLSMLGRNNNNNSSSGLGDNEDDENGHLGISNVSWMNVMSSAAPGGPLGEALCLGNASTTWGGSNLASPARGYSNNNSNNTNSSSCSKSSCHIAHNFIG
ncbi:hypothetical protein CASFOL_010686 [Castilleja foliolosa]|uniref:Growth-regulating factor n=1 Tax=Castilleja foliolosa TaxID=1961234 RepID=A0ABD3DXH4_9LAMI